MSKSAQDEAKKLKRTPDTIRMILCEEVFDIRTGSLAIAVYHPKSKISFTILTADLPEPHSTGYHLALKKSIWHAALTHIPGKTENAAPVTGQGSAAQPALF